MLTQTVTAQPQMPHISVDIHIVVWVNHLRKKSGVGVVCERTNGPPIPRSVQVPTDNTHRALLTTVIGILSNGKFPSGCNLVFYVSSEYVVDGMTVYIPSWRARNWTDDRGEPIKNADLWKQADGLGAAKHQWVFVNPKGKQARVTYDALSLAQVVAK